MSEGNSKASIISPLYTQWNSPGSVPIHFFILRVQFSNPSFLIMTETNRFSQQSHYLLLSKDLLVGRMAVQPNISSWKSSISQLPLWVTIGHMTKFGQCDVSRSDLGNSLKRKGMCHYFSFLFLFMAKIQAYRWKRELPFCTRIWKPHVKKWQGEDSMFTLFRLQYFGMFVTVASTVS